LNWIGPIVNVLKVSNLVKKFGNLVAVNDISFEVGDGEVFGFLGPNGAGKTTTIKIIAGLLKPTAGSVFINDIDVIRNPIEAKKLVAYIPDEPFVYPYLTAREFLYFISEVYGIRNPDKEIDELFEYFSLTDRADEILATYSHGMKQKLLIAGVILRKPKIMLFDEPTVGLDPMSVRKFRELIKRVSANGTTVFICTHILEMAQKICERVCVINRGKIIGEGKISDIIKNNKDLEDFFFNLTE
jgi:ABC-2 type transport system ATP-binding protein